MFDRLPWSLLSALAVALLGAMGVGLVSSSVEAAIIAGFAALFTLVLVYEHDQDDPPRKALDIARHMPPADEPKAFDASAILNALADPAILVRAGQVEDANEAATALLGAHIIKRDIRMAIRHPAVTQHIVGTRTNDSPVETDLVGLGTLDQSWRMRVSPLPREHQLVVLSDQSLRQSAERIRVDFVANASHELRTPLAGILGFIETLADPVAGNDPDTRNRFLAIIDREARRMQRLVEDLMSLSRIEADKYRAPDQPVDIGMLAIEVADVLKQQHGGRGADINVDVEEDQVVAGDRAQLSQLIHNLVSNAMKYGRAGTPITITVKPDRGTLVRLTVADRGDGIASEHLPRLTERFYRVDPGRSRVLGGTGLGLAIVKHIVERHRGRMAIDSVIGEGTTIAVDLPILGKQARGESDATEAMSSN